MPDAPGELEPEGGASYTPGTPGGLVPEGGGAATPGDPGNLTPNTPAAPDAPPSITPETPPSVPAGAQWATQQQAEAGQSSNTLMSPLRTKQAIKVRERFVFPEDYGALGDGTTDDTVAIQSAINAVGVQGGGTILFGSKTYKVSETGSTGYCLICPFQKVIFRGQGASSRIACNTADADTILFAEGVGPYSSGTDPIDHCGVFDLYFNPLVQKTNASFEVRVPFSCRFTMRGIHFGRLDSMISATTPVLESKIGSFFALGDELTQGCIDCNISDIRGFGYYQALRMSRVFDTIITGWTSDANKSAADSVYIVGACESNFFSSCGFVNSGGLNDAATGNCLQILTGTSGAPRLNNFTDCFFDTHGRGLLANGGFSNVFQGCWFGSGLHEGAYLHVAATAYQFIGCRFNATKTEGIAFDFGVNHVLDSCETYSCNRAGGSKGSVRIGAGVTGVRISNHSESNTLFSSRYSAGGSAFGLQVADEAGRPFQSGNNFATGYSAYAGPNRPPISGSGASLALTKSMANTERDWTHSATFNVLVPNDSTENFTIGDSVVVFNNSAFSMTRSASGGVTLKGSSGPYPSGSAVAFVKTSANTWQVI